jgi:hypothetical protein
LCFQIKHVYISIAEFNTTIFFTLKVMTTEHAKIQCAEHDKAYSTFVCEHLATSVSQEWFGNFPEEDNAWCAGCNSIFLREGEWNEKNEKEIKLKIICDCCYAGARSLSVDCLSVPHREKWDDFVANCCSKLESKQNGFDKEFASSEHIGKPTS